MHGTKKLLSVALLCGLLTLPASGQITNWNTGQVIPGTAGITPGPGMDLSYWNTEPHNLRYADLSGGLDLHGSYFYESSLDYARFTGANLAVANFEAATLTNADLSGAFLEAAGLLNANLHAAKLTGAYVGDADLTNANLSGAVLTDAVFVNAMLYNSDLSGATVTGTNFGASWGLTAAQLYSTASYQSRDLHGIGFSILPLSGWTFAGQNLSGASFINATLTNVDFSGAIVTEADFSRRWYNGSPGTGITLAQLYSTSSYQTRSLRGTRLRGNDLTGAILAHQDLSRADFQATTLTGADLTGAIIAEANFSTEAAGYYHDGTGLTAEQLYSTASYQAGDLHGIALDFNDLTGWNLANQNLTGASFGYATLTNANLSGATVAKASFSRAWAGQPGGLTTAQLYSTASYQAGDLHGIELDSHDLTGWNLANQNLTGASLAYATLTNSDLSRADTRGARYLTPAQLSSAIMHNTILPDGHIAGLNLIAGETLKVCDYDGDPNRHPTPLAPIAIHVTDAMNMGTDGVLKMILEEDAWDSTISFDAGIPVRLGGTLELTFAPGVNITGQIGRTFDLFDWTGVSPTGAFNVSSLYGWDLANLYTTGEVTLITPEPSTAGLFALVALVLGRRRQRMWRLQH